MEGQGEAAPPRLIGAAALIGRSDLDGEVELGFGLLPAQQGRGFAGETVAVLSEWGFSNGAARVVAHVAQDQPSGVRALRRNGFAGALETSYPGVTLFARHAGASQESVVK